jgi:hypothetical protein
MTYTHDGLSRFFASVPQSRHRGFEAADCCFGFCFLHSLFDASFNKAVFTPLPSP